ncbi:MAG: ABC transporter ATP-binding protein/permease [Burkholderiales bacterium]|nr:ABC transporter ATP-binding protein/permease [Burkholderiales bacterium]
MTSPAPSFPRRLWRLVRPYFASEARLRALGFLATVVALNLVAVYVDVLLNEFNRDFYNALEQKDFAAFQAQLLRFCYLAFFFIVVAVYKFYLTQLFELRWREWLTRRYIDRWLAHRAYYKVELFHRGTDNPDQRIAEDVRAVTEKTVELSMGLLNSVVTLAAFLSILWAVSGPLAFSVGGAAVSIPGYMVWVAILYALAGSLLIHWIGRPLIDINNRAQKVEADFRYGLVRVRENAESIALYGGEPGERAVLRTRFGAVLDTTLELIRRQKTVLTARVFYAQIAIVFPILVAAPRYFAGSIKLGELMQIASAFGQVQGALSWFIDAYASLAAWKASVDRLLTFDDALAEAERAGALTVEAADAPALAGVDLVTPQGVPIVAGATLAIGAGERWLVSGPSGSGKSTLFRALAGIWPFGRGRIAAPREGVLFLPQRPYLPLGTLKAAVSYPAPADAVDDDAVRAALADCRLPHLVDRLHEEGAWDKRLSPGEQQRVGFARVLINRPRWLFMDESTAALDAPTAQALYALVRERLPDTALVSIAHDTEIARFHDRRIVLTPGDDGSVAAVA